MNKWEEKSSNQFESHKWFSIYKLLKSSSLMNNNHIRLNAKRVLIERLLITDDEQLITLANFFHFFFSIKREYFLFLFHLFIIKCQLKFYWDLKLFSKGIWTLKAMQISFKCKDITAWASIIVEKTQKSFNPLLFVYIKFIEMPFHYRFIYF